MKTNAAMIAVALSIVANHGGALADADVLNAAERVLISRLEALLWADAVTDEGVTLVEDGLRSGRNDLIKVSLTNVVLHRLHGTVSVIDAGLAHPSFLTRSAFGDYGKICAAAMSTSDPIAALRLRMAGPLPGDDLLQVKGRFDGGRPTRDLIRFALVAEEVRAVRAGKKHQTDVAGLALSLFEEQLVAFTRFEPGFAIDRIVAQLLAAQHAHREQYDLVGVLRTFPMHQIAPKVVTALQQTACGSSEYPAYLLLKTLSGRTREMTPELRETLSSALRAVRSCARSRATISLLDQLNAKSD